MNLNQLWQIVLNEIELSISRHNFITWFKDTSILSKENGKISVNVPNAFTKEWLENRYAKQLLKILRSHEPEIKEIKFIINSRQKKIKKPTTVYFNNFDSQEQLNLEINKETNLNPRYTFDSFIRGSFNDLAYAAALSVVKNPGLNYNPLFIYGGVGLGKTHLLQAIGNELTKTTKFKIKYISSEKFTNDFISAILNHNTEKFKKLYRKVDVLIIDDIQFWAEKEKSQEEFFHTFNSLYEANKQIVLSSDRPPKAIPALEDRLRSRFEGGMIADIGYPDYETRIAILKSKLALKNKSLSEEILDYIATNIKDNIREMEGALNRILSYIDIHNTVPTGKKLEKIFGHIIKVPKKNISFKKVLKTIAEFYDVNEKHILSKNRHQELVKARQILMYFLRKEFNNSYPYIGKKLGGRDHTTVIHACEKIEKEIEKDNGLIEEINSIKQKLYC